MAAAILTTAAYIPQAYKTIRTRATANLSLPTYILLLTGTLLWLAYGIFLQNVPIILANVITALLAGIILYIKLAKRGEDI